MNTTALAIAVLLYTVVLFVVSWWARSRIHTTEDFVVAGRKLPFGFSTATIFATWFGAGTLMTSANQVREMGLRETALEPIGPALCLIAMGVFFARRLWTERFLTIYDLYGHRFGRKVEMLATLYTIGFVPWIATQFKAAAGICALFFDVSPETAIYIVAAVAMGYTLVGGMWSVTITDALQVVLVLAGLLILAWNVLSTLGGGNGLVTGAEKLLAVTDAEDLIIVPTEKADEFFRWLSLFLSGTIGIVFSQELIQRVFSARTARTAASACIASGVLYLLFGSLAVVMGLAGKHLLGPDAGDVIPALGAKYLSSSLAIIFVLSIISTILSTLDSAILAPATVLAQNLLRHATGERLSVLWLTRVSICLITALSVWVAVSEENAFALLEASYASGIAPFFVIMFALYSRRTYAPAAFITLLFGLVVWVLEQNESSLGWTMPIPWEIVAGVVTLSVYGLLHTICALRDSER